jgi:hypothetical protein
MTRVNLYKVVYDESAVVGIPKESELYKKVLEEAKSAANVIQAQSLREALDKAEAQSLTFFKVHNLEIKEQQVNLI